MVGVPTIPLILTLAAALSAAPSRECTAPLRDVPELDHALAETWASTAATPSASAPADVWLRRAWLDLAGTPPPPAAREAWLAKPDRAAAVAELLASPQTEARWARLLAGMLAPPEARADAEALRPLEAELRDALHADRPWHQVLGALAPGRGGKAEAAARVVLGVAPNPMAGRLAGGMLGLKIGCAQCHDDPAHGWTAEDYYQLSAFFARPRMMRAPSRLIAAFRAGRVLNLYQLVMNLPEIRPRGEDHRWVRQTVIRYAELLGELHRMGIGSHPPPDLNGVDWAASDVYRLHRMRAMSGQGGGFGATTAVPIPGTVEELRMPALVALPGQPRRTTVIKTGQLVPPRFPGDQENSAVHGKRQEALAEWLADPENPYAARALVNRVWAQLLGRGLVEPRDEVAHAQDRALEPLLTRLACGFTAGGGSVKKLLREVVLSAAYARATPAGALPVEEARAGAPVFAYPVTAAVPMPTPSGLSLATAIPAPTASAEAVAAPPAPPAMDAPVSAFPTAALYANAAPASGTTTAIREMPAPPGNAVAGPAGPNDQLLQSMGFPENEEACTRQYDRERPLALHADPHFAAASPRPLDLDQILTALAIATARPAGVAPRALADEIRHALELWEETGDGVFPPRVLAAGPALQEFVRTAPLLEELAGLATAEARLARLYEVVLSRRPTAEESKRALMGVRSAASWSAEAGRGWAELLWQTVSSTEFLTNH